MSEAPVFASNEAFHRYLDTFVEKLAKAGHHGIAIRIDDLLHHTAWTTSSELVGELRASLDAFLRSPPAKQAEIVAACREVIAIIRSAGSVAR
jgi:malate synthase